MILASRVTEKRIITLVFLLIGNVIPRADQMIFPPDSRIVDVTKPPYNVRPDGKQDVTRLLQQAIDDHPSRNAIIYLPPGIYRVSDTIRWSRTSDGNAWKRIILQGAGPQQTMIRLADHTPAFGPQAAVRSKAKKHIKPSGKPVIWTGKAPAQRFRNAIRDLTIHTGSGNPGATGVQFIANNQGCIRNVVIQSGDGTGVVGLDLGYTDEQGPCLIQNVTVKGFNIGIYCWGAVDSITFSGITLQNQISWGIRNEHQVISIEKLNARGPAPVLNNVFPDGVVTLLHADLTATPAQDKTAQRPAIINRGVLYARHIKAVGYSPIIRDRERRIGTGEIIAEYTSHPPLVFPEQSASLPAPLPIRETPDTVYPPLTDWVSPTQFGAKPNDKVDDTIAFQAAIDSGKRVLY
ncbi:MAG: hypothetical protein D6820_12330, partial [Lentisphaerae bacterium]